MRKLLASAFIILIFPLIFTSFVKAEETYANLDEFQDKLYEVEGFRLPNNDSLITYWKNNPDKVLFFGRRSGGAAAQACFGTDLYVEQNQNTYNIKNHDADIYSLYSSGSSSYQPPSYYWDGWNYNYGVYEGIEGVTIDFDNLYYSAQLPVPTIDVYMDNSVDYPSAGQAVWNATIEIGDNSQYYIQWGYKISWPTYIDLGLSGMQGDITYNYYGYLSGQYTDIVTMESLTSAVAQGATANSFQSAWNSLYTMLSSEQYLPEFASSINAMSQTMINNAKQYYIDYMLTQIPMYGNRLEVFARYFIIDSENNNRIVVGAWNHWNSKDGSRTKERPTNYIDNVALPGYISTNDDTSYQDNSNTYSNNGESTGTPATIINNNYAPNYPDYPTVATYNHDNILLNFMDTAKQLPSFFGEFTSFLTVAFSFIPSWIWAIIGTGFTFSIVIMIIKVL